MKVSCIPINFHQKFIDGSLTLIEWFKLAKLEVGLDGTEIYEPYLKSLEVGYLRQLLAVLESYGLQVSMFTSYTNFGTPNPVERQKQKEHLMQVIDAAATLKAPYVRITGGRWVEGISYEQTIENIAEGIKGCLDYAETRQVLLALEDHPEVGTKIADLLAILDAVADERLKINLDTSNTLEAGEDAVELCQKVAHRVVHLHCSDRLQNLSHCEVGTGIVNFKEIFKILKLVGFDGWLSIESGTKAGVEGMRREVEFIKRVWAEV